MILLLSITSVAYFAHERDVDHRHKADEKVHGIWASLVPRSPPV